MPTMILISPSEYGRYWLLLTHATEIMPWVEKFDRPRASHLPNLLWRCLAGNERILRRDWRQVRPDGVPEQREQACGHLKGTGRSCGTLRGTEATQAAVAYRAIRALSGDIGFGRPSGKPPVLINSRVRTSTSWPKRNSSGATRSCSTAGSDGSPARTRLPGRACPDAPARTRLPGRACPDAPAPHASSGRGASVIGRPGHQRCTLWG